MDIKSIFREKDCNDGDAARRLQKMFFVLCGIMMLCGHSIVSGEVILKKIEPFANYVVKKVDERLVIDGNLSEWGNISPIILLRKGGTKADEDNLSVKVYLMYDEDNLYFAAEVRDDIFFQPYRDSQMWKGDSIQIAFDPLCDGKSAYIYGELQKAFDKVNGRKRGEKTLFEGYNSDDYQYGFALTGDSPQVWQWIPEPERAVSAIGLAIINKGKRLIYEASIPWKEISPFKLKEDMICGFKVVAFNNDGAGPKLLEWTPWNTHVAKDRRTFGNLLFLPAEETLKLYIRNLARMIDNKVSGQLSIFSSREGDSEVELQIRDKGKVVFTGSKTINIDRGANLIEFAIGTKKLPYGEYNLKVIVYDSKGIKQEEVNADITKVNSDEVYEKFVKVGDYRKSLTDISKLTKVAFIDIGVEGDEKYLDSKLNVGEPIVKLGQTVRQIISKDPKGRKQGGGKCVYFKIPICPKERNLIQIQMYRDSVNRGIVQINDRVGTIFCGRDWYIAECVVEGFPRSFTNLGITSGGNTYVDWIAVYKDGESVVKKPKPICAWNAPIRKHFVKTAPNGRHLMFDDGRIIYPVGVSAQKTFSPWAGWATERYDEKLNEEYVRTLSPYINTVNYLFRPLRICPSRGEINENRLKVEEKEIDMYKKYGVYSLLNTMDQMRPGVNRPRHFQPASEDYSHQIFWTEYLAKRYKARTDILTWSVCEEPGCLLGNAYEQQLWHRTMARVLKKYDKNHLVGTNTWGWPGYVGNMDNLQLQMIGGEETIDWVSIHPHTATSHTILIQKFAEASLRNKKPCLTTGGWTLLDTYDPFHSSFWRSPYAMYGDESEEDTPWFERLLYGIFDGQASMIPWGDHATLGSFNALSLLRKVAEKVNWVDFDPAPRVAVECIPYTKMFVDKDIRKIILELTKDKGIPYDLVFEWQAPGEYDFIIRSSKDLSKVDKYRDVKCNTWSKYLIDKNGRYVLIWIKADKKPSLSIKGLNRGKYLIDWISLETGDIELTEERAVGKNPLKIAYSQKGDFVVYVHPKTNYTANFEGFNFIKNGVGSSVLVGPEDVPLGMVSFNKETPLFVYMHSKEMVETLRDRSGVMLPLKTPAELSEEDKKSKNILLAGDIKSNPIVKRLKENGCLNNPLRETSSCILITSPWNAGKKVLIIKGSQEKKVVENIDKIMQTMFSGD